MFADVLDALAEAVCPIRDGDAEGLLDLCLVENAERRTGNRTGELAAVAGLNVAGGLAAVLLDHLREVIPAADALVAVMVDALVHAAVLCVIVYDCEDCTRKVPRVGGGADLVEDNLQLRLRGGEIQHGPAEVLAELAVEPGGADDHMGAAILEDALLAMELREAVHAGGSPLLVFTAWSVVWFLAEHIVGADVDEESVPRMDGLCQIRGSVGVELLRQGEVAFSRIDVGECGAVDDHVNAVLLNCIKHGIVIRDIKIDGLLTILLIYISEDKTVAAVPGCKPDFITQLSVGSCDKYFHIIIARKISNINCQMKGIYYLWFKLADKL